MTTAIAGKALLVAPKTEKSPSAPMIVRVAREHGISPFRQMAYMMTRLRGRHQLAYNEYYTTQAYRKDFTKAEKNAFVGAKANAALNIALSPSHVNMMYPFIMNKALYGALLRQLGLSSTKTQAIATHAGGFGNIPALHTADAIADFLRRDAQYPLFGKPAAGSRSIGSVLIASYNKLADTVTLGNGRVYDVAAFAGEIHKDYPKGYLLQDAVKQHKDMTDLAGPALGSVRIVTVNDGDGPKVLYTLWKVPSPTAMSDNFWQAGSMLAAVDKDTGKVTSCRKGSGPDSVEIDAHPVSGTPFVGFQIPDWDAATKLAIEAHNLFPEFGVFGWDMGIGQDGPVIVECNSSPFHTLYQMANLRGIKNPDFMPVFTKIAARQAALKPVKGKKAKKARAK